MRLRVDLGYDGAEFSGWAKQPGLRTVEGVLADGLSKVLRLPSPLDLTVAGRTDAGVHARGQVAHSDAPAAAWLEHGDRVLFRLRSVLPPDVRVTDVQVAPAGFDARFAATSRRYVYRLGDHPTGIDPIRRHDIVWHRRALDVELLSAAAAELLGEHDFAAFCRKREGASTVRTLKVFNWQRLPDGLLNATVVADAFCHNMVRSLVGACVTVGDGRHDTNWVRELLATAHRSSSVAVLPARGLTLEEVTYPPDVELAAQAHQARRYRG